MKINFDKLLGIEYSTEDARTYFLRVKDMSAEQAESIVTVIKLVTIDFRRYACDDEQEALVWADWFKEEMFCRGWCNKANRKCAINGVRVLYHDCVQAEDYWLLDNGLIDIKDMPF